MATLLEVDNAVAGYGQTQVVNGFSLAVDEQKCIALCGPNGHGKTTMMRAISGLLPLWEGEIRYDGQSMHRRKPQEIVEAGVIHVPQGNRLFPELSIIENLRLGAYNRRAREQEEENLDTVLRYFPKLQARRRQKCRTLSGGERQMLALGVGLMGAPRLLILDEPNLGLAPIIKAEVSAVVEEIAKKKLTVVLIDQDIDFLLDVADELHVVEHGQVIAGPDETSRMNRDDILNLYFGTGQ